MGRYQAPCWRKLSLQTKTSCAFAGAGVLHLKHIPIAYKHCSSMSPGLIIPTVHLQFQQGKDRLRISTVCSACCPHQHTMGKPQLLQSLCLRRNQPNISPRLTLHSSSFPGNAYCWNSKGKLCRDQWKRIVCPWIQPAWELHRGSIKIKIRRNFSFRCL